MFSRFFIDRPVFAAVISILITLAGLVAIPTLPVSQYPQVTPPTVQVDCNYPGASAQVVASTVAAPIEQQVNGVEEMLYMNSQSTNDGSYTLTVTFKPGVDLNVGLVLVQNRVSLALPQLPDVVRQAGVNTRKRSPEILLTVSLHSPQGKYDQLYLSNYALMNVKDELARIPGISEVFLFGQRDYSMRVWVDPDRLAVRDLAVSDVLAALREQNLQPAVGHIGQPPGPDSQAVEIPLSIRGRLVEPEEFENIILRTTKDGRIIRIKDVGRAELGARSQDIANRFDGKATVGIAIFLLPSANALETADEIKAMMKTLSKDFPEGVEYAIGYDTSPFIRESIHEVFKSLRDSIILVSLVVLVFLQGWRPAIIPLIAVPVAIIGTFAAMALSGFSINNLTLFGLVLAIGIVVDDAIVVVEAVEHFIEKGLPPRAAALRAMEEVSGPVIAVGLVLAAVFIPCAFLSGLFGVFFRQFALTIAVSTLLSTINSLTLSPALAAMLLRKPGTRRDPLTWLLDMLLGWLFKLFNFGFRWSTSGYTWLVGKLLRVPLLVLAGYAGLLLLTGWSYQQLPQGFVPSTDKGYLISAVQLPDAASALRTREAIARIEKVIMETKGVKNVNSVAGNAFVLSAYGSNFGTMFIILDGFEKRQTPDLHCDEIAKTLRGKIAKEVPEAMVNIFPAPAVPGLGRAGGFRIMIEDRGDNGLVALQTYTDAVIKAGNGEAHPSVKGQPGAAGGPPGGPQPGGPAPGGASPGGSKPGANAGGAPGGKPGDAPKPPQMAFQGLFTAYKANSPQLYIDIDRDQCLKQGVALGDLFGTLQGFLGSRYVNDFNRFDRTWQVIVQADANYRNQVDDVPRLKVRNNRGKMVPVGSMATVKEITGPLIITRYNMYPAAPINGSSSPGVSSGQAIEILERIAAEQLPGSMSYEWTEITYLERSTTNTGLQVFSLAVMFVFLVLAALYESWSLPLAVILVVPMCVLSSLVGVWKAGHDINVFTQIGFVVLVGLACKNAILIVEFAKLRRDEGVDRRAATLHACELRLRPILMTSFAFILGVVPLVYATGAGAEMRRTLGTAVFSGMIGVTFFGILLTPVFFYVIDWLAEGGSSRSAALRRAGHRAGQFALAAITLRPVRQAAAWAGRALADYVRRRAESRRNRQPRHPVAAATTKPAPTKPATPTPGRTLIVRTHETISTMGRPEDSNGRPEDSNGRHDTNGHPGDSNGQTDDAESEPITSTPQGGRTPQARSASKGEPGAT